MIDDSKSIKIIQTFNYTREYLSLYRKITLTMDGLLIKRILDTLSFPQLLLFSNICLGFLVSP